jgi:hypothetical protein
MAPAQFDRRMTSQMDLMAELTDCCVAWRLPLPVAVAVAVADFPATVLGFLGMRGGNGRLEISDLKPQISRMARIKEKGG